MTIYTDEYNIVSWVLDECGTTLWDKWIKLQCSGTGTLYVTHTSPLAALSVQGALKHKLLVVHIFYFYLYICHDAHQQSAWCDCLVGLTIQS